jgi:hypothetical protein
MEKSSSGKTTSPKQGQPGSKEKAKEGNKPLPAGPHSKPELTNTEATPGSGMLPDDPEDENMQPSG